MRRLRRPRPRNIAPQLGMLASDGITLRATPLLPRKMRASDVPSHVETCPETPDPSRATATCPSANYVGQTTLPAYQCRDSPRKMLSSWTCNKRPMRAPQMTYARSPKKALKRPTSPDTLGMNLLVRSPSGLNLLCGPVHRGAQPILHVRLRSCPTVPELA